MTAGGWHPGTGAAGPGREAAWWIAPLAAMALHGVLLGWLALPRRAAPPPAPVLRVQWLPAAASPAPAPPPQALPVQQPSPAQAAPSRAPRPRQPAAAQAALASSPSPTGLDQSTPALAHAVASESLARPAEGAPPPPAAANPSAPQPPELVSTPARYDAAYLSNPEPPYPPAARARGEVGTVRLRVRVGADGRPEAVELAQSSGYAQLDRAAENTVRLQWRFVPAQRGGSPVADMVIVPIAFRLQ